MKVVITGENLTLEDLVAVARNGAEVDPCLQRRQAARTMRYAWV